MLHPTLFDLWVTFVYRFEPLIRGPRTLLTYLQSRPSWVSGLCSELLMQSAASALHCGNARALDSEAAMLHLLSRLGKFFWFQDVSLHSNHLEQSPYTTVPLFPLCSRLAGCYNCNVVTFLKFGFLFICPEHSGTWLRDKDRMGLVWGHLTLVSDSLWATDQPGLQSAPGQPRLRGDTSTSNK